MKRANSILAMSLLVMSGCGGGNKQPTDDFITVDVEKSYPKKELILQDVFDVEYILLDDTEDEFLTDGLIRAIGKETIIVRNYGNTGDILLFDRNGKGLRTINRRGQGPGEYAAFSHIALDEDNNEIFVLAAMQKKIFVYDLFGNFKRSLAWDRLIDINVVDNFDRDNLICVIYTDMDSPIEIGGAGNEEHRFFIMSKKDGHITTLIVPYKKKIRRTFEKGMYDMTVLGPTNQVLIPNRDSWVLVEPSSDTIYRLLPDLRMIPYIVRTPSIQSMNPEVFLSPSIITDRYVFMQTVKKQIIFETPTDRRYPRRDVMCDIYEKAIFEYAAYNDDFVAKRPVNLAFQSSAVLPFLNKEIAFFQKLESHELVEAYEKGELKGKLKELAAELNEESNPVIMLLKHKK